MNSNVYRCFRNSAFRWSTKLGLVDSLLLSFLGRRVQVKEALVQFDAALEMNPNEEEAQAALYNKACCHARRCDTILVDVSVMFSLAPFQVSTCCNSKPGDPDSGVLTPIDCCSDEGEKASQALRRALKEYDLKFSVILNDPDMAPFRALPEFKQLQDEVKKNATSVACKSSFFQSPEA
jgi:hypothetical protein